MPVINRVERILQATPTPTLPEITALVASFLALALAATIVLTPMYALPVGVTVAEGDSMGDDGPQAVVYAATGSVSEGDVIVFAAGDTYVRHRVIGHTENGYVTKGDSNPVIDQPGYPYATSDTIRGEVMIAAPLGWVQGVVGLLLGVLALFGAAKRQRQIDGMLYRAKQLRSRDSSSARKSWSDQ